ncbi:hypothetical protein BGZ52_004180 [Haplosporangium bisporale]|nr:hypothetical protein BGZ52_004180 [Haplosporangium bisporale]
MVKPNLFLASAAFLAIAAKTAEASFALCVGKTGKPFGWVTGYYLWNEGNDNSAAYDSFGPFTGRAKLGGQNGWSVQVQDYGSSVSVWVYNSKYDFPANIQMETLCTSDGVIAYGCYSNSANWCNANREGQKAACRQHVEMGSNSVRCLPRSNSGNRPSIEVMSNTNQTEPQASPIPVSV